MGIEIQLEDERGNRIKYLPDGFEFVLKLINAIPKEEEENCKCLSMINPYGDTTFNCLQIPYLINEIMRASQFCKDPDAIDHGRKTIDLGQEAMKESHTYLKFYGD